MKITNGLYYIGMALPDMEVFDVYMKLDRGTSYNSYMLTGNKYNAVIELANDDDTDYDLYVSNIKKVLNGGTLDFIVFHHTEMDHVIIDNFDKFMDEFPGVSIVATKTAHANLLEIVHSNRYKPVVIEDRQSLNLGGLTLEFFVTPFTHWPDTMISYCPELSAFFTCDVFGSHFCPWKNSTVYNTDEPDPAVFLSHTIEKGGTELDDYLRNMDYYFQWILKPYSSFSQKAFDIVKERQPELKYIFSSHGPIIDGEKSVELVLDHFQELLAEPEKKHESGLDVKDVLVVYTSAHGFTRKMAKIIRATNMKLKFFTSRVSKRLVKIRLMDTVGEKPYLNPINFHFVDLYDDEAREKATELLGSIDALLIGAPTLLRDAPVPIMQFISSINQFVNKNIKLVSAFGSYGWSGEGTSNVISRFAQMNFTVMKPLRIKFNPSQDTKKIEAFYYKFVNLLYGKASKKEVAENEEYNEKLKTHHQKLKSEILDLKDGISGIKAEEEEEEKVWIDDGIIKEWKCIVCGDVVRSVMPPDFNCPVCGVEPDCWVFLQIPKVEEKSLTQTTESPIRESDDETESEVDEITKDGDDRERPNRIVIIGASAAGMAACKEIREHDEEVDILILSKEPYFPYYRPRISNFDLVKDISQDGSPGVFIIDKEYLEDNSVRLLLNATVVNIDTAKKRIMFTETFSKEDLQERGVSRMYGREFVYYQKDGKKKKKKVVSYDRLIIATGSHQVFPLERKRILLLKKKEKKEKQIEKEGISLYDNAFGFYTMGDLLEVTKYVEKKGLGNGKGTVLFIGAGPLALELTESFKKLGFQRIILIEPRSYPLSRKLDVGAGRFLETQLLKRQIEIFSNYEVFKFKKDGRIIRKVYLRGTYDIDSGKDHKVEIPVDIVLYASGVRSTVTLVKGTDIEVKSGIVVNNQMETSVKDIYACGDCIEENGENRKSWNHAIETGKVAAKNALGIVEKHTNYPSPSLVNVFGFQVYSNGQISEFERSVEALTSSSPMGNIYLKMFFRIDKSGSQIVGAIYVGADRTVANNLTKAIMGSHRMQDVIEQLIIRRIKNSVVDDTGHKNSLDKILQSKRKITKFREFLKSEFNEETIDFIVEVDKYRSLGSKRERKKLGTEIFDKYIKINGFCSLNLSDRVRRECYDEYKNGKFEKTLFDSPYSEIKKLLEHDSLTRFAQ